jgi:cytochrome bd-type quinol oxidase subunit 1
MFDDWFEHVILLLLLIFILVGMYGMQPGLIVTDFISVIINVVVFALHAFVWLATSSVLGFLIAIALAYFLVINRDIMDWNSAAWMMIFVAILVLIV